MFFVLTLRFSFRSEGHLRADVRPEALRALLYFFFRNRGPVQPAARVRGCVVRAARVPTRRATTVVYTSPVAFKKRGKTSLNL